MTLDPTVTVHTPTGIVRYSAVTAVCVESDGTATLLCDDDTIAARSSDWTCIAITRAT